MRAGRLRQRITIQQLTTTQDANTGEGIESWADHVTLWADVRPLNAREYIAAAATQAQLNAMVTIRYRSDIVPTMRIVYNGKTYNIDGVLPDSRSGREWLTIPVSEDI